MNQISKQITFILLAVASSFSLQAKATKLTATPLPHRSDLQTMDGQEVSPPISRYNRPKQAPKPSQTKTQESESQSASIEATTRKAEQEKIKAEELKEDQALSANNKAVQLGQLGKFEEAIAAHEEAVQLAPESKQYRVNLSAAYCAYGQKLLAKNNFVGAAHLFRQSLAAASDNGLAGKLLIEALKKSGIDPSSAEARLALGDQLLGQGDLSSAGIEYQAAEELEESGRTFTKMGDYAYRLGQADMATNWYRQAIIKTPDYAPAYRQLGYLAIAKQDPTEAAELLRKAVILDSKDNAAGQTLVGLWHKQVAANPQIAENHLGLASALQLTGDLAGAEIEYGKVSAIDPRNPSLSAAQASLKRAYQHSEAQKHKEAAQTLAEQDLKQEALMEMSQAVRLEPKNAQYQFCLGQCLESVGNIQGASQAYLTCVLIDPENNKEAAAHLKVLQQSANNSSPQENLASKTIIAADKSNINYLSAANTINQNPNPPDKNSVLNQLENLETARNYEAAINMLRQIVSNNLENPEMHHRLAVNLMSAGQIGEAISEFRIASALCPTQKTYADDLAQALTINKQALDTGDKGTNQ